MMKKYLMMGIALAALASCTKHDIEYVNPDVVKYEQVFTNRFGTPSPTHTWGFGSGITRGVTRGSNDNKNQWGNPNYGNWQVPPVLSEGQILRVKTYFQQNPNLTFEAPDYSTYFVQQVYKGHDDANENFSKEIYKSANSSTYNVIGSSHMDKLTVGPDNLHVDNFNYGTYNGGVGLDVLNTGATDESNSANYHKDMITLIEDVRPTCVGFNESESSYQHNDHAALVSAATIDAWIVEKFGADYGEAVNDDWHRDFVGLDYEATPAADTYVKDANNEIVYATIGDFDMGKTYVWDGSHFYLMSEVRNNLLKTPQNVTFPVVSAEKNKYLGDYVKIDQNNLVTEFEGGVMMDDLNVDRIADDASRTRKHQVLDLTKIFNLVGNGECAAVQNDKGGFVKNFGGRDYYFSDWIVTLTPAKKQTTITETYDIRVMAEDLTTTENSDFDFNDIVFDVKWITDNKAKIKILAAGGIYPIYVENVNNEAHKLLTGATGNYTMTNTYAGRHYEYSAEPFEVEGNFNRNAANIKVYVQKPGQAPQELIAPTGKVASKIGVPTTVDWCDEYQDIDEKWGGSKDSGKFAAWVADENNKFWE